MARRSQLYRWKCGRFTDALNDGGSRIMAAYRFLRVVEPADVAVLAVHIMTNTALTGATYDIDGGQQLVSASLLVAAQLS